MDWADVAFSKAHRQQLKALQPVFIAAPRELSVARFKQLVKAYLPGGPLLLGIAAEPYIDGFERQPQFKTLRQAAVQPVIDAVNASASPHKIYTLTYAQRDLRYIFETLRFSRVVLVNGSWKYSFHTQPPYYALAKKATPYDMVSPFISETAAEAYADEHRPILQELWLPPPGAYSETAMLAFAGTVAKQSYDYSFQTGVVLGRNTDDNTYELLTATCNQVVPFETYAMHYGASRETYFSPPHDLNHYDTVHAEVAAIVDAQKKGIDLRGSTMFINLMPCPSCARMLATTDIAAFVYTIDHSEGYAVHLFEAAGKEVRRIVTKPIKGEST